MSVYSMPLKTEDRNIELRQSMFDKKEKKDEA